MISLIVDARANNGDNNDLRPYSDCRSLFPSHRDGQEPLKRQHSAPLGLISSLYGQSRNILLLRSVQIRLISCRFVSPVRDDRLVDFVKTELSSSVRSVMSSALFVINHFISVKRHTVALTSSSTI